MKKFKEKLIDQLKVIVDSYGLELIEVTNATFYIQSKDSFTTIIKLDFIFYDTQEFFSLKLDADWNIVDYENWEFNGDCINYMNNEHIQQLFDSLEKLLNSKYQKSC